MGIYVPFFALFQADAANTGQRSAMRRPSNTAISPNCSNTDALWRGRRNNQSSVAQGRAGRFLQHLRMVEVKSTTSVKDCHSDAVAIQAFVARSSGVSLQAVALLTLTPNGVCHGDEDYQGLLKETDLTEQAFSRSEEVESWIAEARNIDALPNEPFVEPAVQCSKPYPCGFVDHCRRDDIQPEYPICWLPTFRAAKTEYMGYKDAVDKEIEVGIDLRSAGFGVWQA